jgi:hypothetical protein
VKAPGRISLLPIHVCCHDASLLHHLKLLPYVLCHRFSLVYHLTYLRTFVHSFPKVPPSQAQLPLNRRLQLTPWTNFNPSSTTTSSTRQMSNSHQQSIPLIGKVQEPSKQSSRTPGKRESAPRLPRRVSRFRMVHLAHRLPAPPHRKCRILSIRSRWVNPYQYVPQVTIWCVSYSPCLHSQMVE